jgi:GT2 family glycosyltransferase
VAETLHSIREQTHRDLRVVISVDGPDPESEEACRPFLEDARFRMVVQPENLGWAQNISWLMDQVETPFWCYQQQDDLLDPRYLETLVEHARTAPKASIVYCDIKTFGDKDATLAQPSLTGTPFARQLTQLVERHAAVAFRGLTRLDALRRVGGVPTNEVGCFSCDTAWVSAAARYGEHHRVPVSLYFKRYHPAQVHPGWAKWPGERRARAWIVHCADLLDQAMATDADQAERRLLWVAAAARVVSNRAYPGYLPDSSLSTTGRDDLLETFLRYVRNERAVDLPRLLGARWRRIRRWARELSLPR